jgi:hypothetical protein
MIVVAVCGLLALLVLGSIWRGYALTVLWAWFVVPVFHLPVLSIAPAIGLSLIVSFLTYQYDAKTPTDGDATDEFVRAAIGSFLLPLAAIGIGWIVHQFMIG